MKKRYFILFLCCVSWFTGRSAVTDSARIEHHATWKNWQKETAWQNPAIHGLSLTLPYSEVYVQMDYLHQSAPFVLQKGTGHFLSEAKAETFLRLSNHSSAWGAASYMTGKQYQVSWNSSSDYDLLNPYILADTLGGDTHCERYGFQGGYAVSKGKFQLGIEAIFRAEHEYRNVDPRMRGIVTDLTLRLGTAYDFGKYQWAAGLEGNVYKQTNDVDFYRELGVIPEFQMTGLGTEYSRFSGDKRTLYYKGGGYGINLDANPLNETGFYGHAKLWRRQYKRMLADLNSVPLTQLFYHSAEVSLGWKHMGGSRQVALDGNLVFVRRSGDENIIGKSSAQYYPIIGKLTMYKNYLIDTYLRGLYGWGSGSGTWCLNGKIGYWSNRERYVYPERKMEAAKIYGRLGGQWMRSLSRTVALTVDMAAAYYGNVSSGIVMPYANMKASFQNMINHQYQFEKAGYGMLSAKIRSDYRLSGSQIGLFAELGGDWITCSENGHQHHLHLALGITF